MKNILIVIAAALLSGCALDQKRITYMSNGELCETARMDLFYQSDTLSSVYQELNRRGYDCTSYNMTRQSQISGTLGAASGYWQGQQLINQQRYQQNKPYNCQTYPLGNQIMTTCQ